MSHVTLGGRSHKLKPVTIGALEEVQATFKAEFGSPIARTVAVLNALAETPIDASTPARLDELNAAMREALANAGFKLAEDAPGNGAAPATSGA